MPTSTFKFPYPDSEPKHSNVKNWEELTKEIRANPEEFNEEIHKFLSGAGFYQSKVTEIKQLQLECSDLVYAKASAALNKSIVAKNTEFPRHIIDLFDFAYQIEETYGNGLERPSIANDDHTLIAMNKFLATAEARIYAQKHKIEQEKVQLRYDEIVVNNQLEIACVVIDRLQMLLMQIDADNTTLIGTDEKDKPLINDLKFYQEYIVGAKEFKFVKIKHTPFMIKLLKLQGMALSLLNVNDSLCYFEMAVALNAMQEPQHTAIVTEQDNMRHWLDVMCSEVSFTKSHAINSDGFKVDNPHLVELLKHPYAGFACAFKKLLATPATKDDAAEQKTSTPSFKPYPSSKRGFKIEL